MASVNARCARRTLSCCAVALAQAGAATSVHASGAPAGGEVATPPELRAVRGDGAAVRVDGLADEAPWRDATVVTGLTSYLPVEGAEASGQLVARLFYDDKALYISARITMPPGRMRGRLAPRERWNNDDLFEVMIDPFLDRRTGYAFTLSPYGVQLDWTIVDDTWSDAWDGVWDSATVRYADGFSVEMRIPFRTLRFARSPVQDWGIGFGLYSGARKQYDKWPAMSADRGAVFAQLGTLRGLQAVEPSRNLDLIPTAVMGYGGSAGALGEFAWDDVVLARAREPGLFDPGLDVRYGVTPSTNLNLAVNPDFSQIEADVDQLEYNLRFPVALQEKRAFFLEGVSLFETPVPLLYTRSVVDPLVGLKLSGREACWTFGLLSAWDQRPAASQLAEARERSGFEDVTGKDAILSIGRATFALSERSRIGVFIADKALRDRGTGAFEGRNDVASVDAAVTLSEIYHLVAQAAGSYTQGVDPAPNQAGWFTSVLARRRDQHLFLELRSQLLSDGFRAESSALSRVGVAQSSAEVSYRHAGASLPVPYLEPALELLAIHDLGELALLDYEVRPSLSTRLGLSAEVMLYYQRGQETFGRRFAGIDQVGLSLEAHPWNSLSVVIEAQAGDQLNYQPMDLFLGTSASIAAATVVNPTDNMELEVRYTRSVLWRPGGQRAAEVDLYYGKAIVSFSTRWAARLISQLDTFDDTLRNSALLSYQLSPGTEAYLGYQDTSVLASEVHVIDRRIFFKGSWRWQP